MTQEHREQFLATEGWQQTERGHFRKDGFQYSEDSGSVRVTHMTHAPVKFRRFPFGRQPKHDALVGWFDLGDKLLDRGGLYELNKMANKTGAYKDVSDGKPLTRVGVTWSWESSFTLPTKKWPIDWDLFNPYGNKRQGWKTIEVGDGEKKERVVVEVIG